MTGRNTGAKTPTRTMTHHLTVKQVRRTLSRAGMPRWSTSGLDLDALHALLSDAMERTDSGSADGIVVVDEEGARTLNMVVTTAIARIRPDRRNASFNAVVSRSTAAKALGTSSVSLDLTDLEAALATRSGIVTVVLEEEDFQETMDAMSTMLDSIPHGGSASQQPGR